MKKVSLLLLFFTITQSINAQNYQTDGKEFWFGFMENLDLLFNGDPDFSVYVFSKEAGTGTLSAPATGLTIPFSYQANSMQKVELPSAIYYDEGSEDIENYGLKLDVSTDAQVFVYHYRIYFSESSLIFPIDALGTEYRVAAALDFNMAAGSPSSFLVIATEDNTEVEITPTGLTLGLRPAGVPFTITLNSGQSYQVQSLNDLSGTYVRSTNNNKLAVFGGAKQGNVSCVQADSHLYDQLLPINNAATTYPLIPFANQGFSVFKIIATEDDTELYLNNESTPFNVINAGEFHEFELSTSKILNSNKPIHVVQLTVSSSCSSSGLGDPNMLTLAPIQMRVKETGLYNFDRFTTDFDLPTARRFVTLFTETENIGNVTINNQDVSGSFESFPDFPNYQFARIELDTGAMTLKSPEGVLAYAYGLGPYDAYTYHLAYESPNLSSTNLIAVENEIKVWPKPFTNNLNIKNLTTKKMDQLLLYDVNGRTVFSQKLLEPKQTSTWNLTQLPLGVYFLQYKIDNILYATKVVKGN